MLELKNITYIVKDRELDKVVLDNVTYTFLDNQVTAITGHNGSGKSTLTKIIMGIIKPTSGKVIFNGVDITDLGIDERAKLGINYAFQQPVTFKGITVKELIDIASNDSNSVPKACEYLSKVGICAKDYINREYDKTLSGGEQKRIELALAIAKKGNTIIFDEPEAGIDLWSFERLNNLFDTDKSYIVVSHQQRLLERADQLLILEKGRVKEYGRAKSVLKKINNLSCTRVSGGGNETR